MFIDIEKRIKEIKAAIDFVQARVTELEKDLPKESDWVRKHYMQQNRKDGISLIKKYEADIKELGRFL